MSFIDIFVYFAVAAVAGGINAVAGGGTFLTFPILILQGLTPLQANITSTIAMWPGSVASAVAYRSQLDVGSKRLNEFIAISLAGSAVGAGLLLTLPETSFERLVPWLLLFATLIFTFGGSLSKRMPATASMQGKTTAALQFAIAVYGGYFGAGIGILMLALLQLLGLSDIHRMNALKTVLASAINAVAVLLFIVAGKVVWSVAVVMITGALAGGWFGAHSAMKAHPRTVRRFVSFTGAAMTVYFFTRGM